MSWKAQKNRFKGEKEMVSFNYVITDPVGLHARPAGLLVKELKNYKSTIVIKKGEKSADARRLMAVMGMGVKTGEEVTVEVTGEDEETAAVALEAFFAANL